MVVVTRKNHRPPTPYTHPPRFGGVVPRQNVAPVPSLHSPAAVPILPPIPYPLSPSTNIAIASSGLGHISRGIETWAADLAQALHAAGIPATLFKGAPSHGATTSPQEITLSCWKRSDAKTRRLLRFTRRGGWRIGLGSPYGIEQSTFALKLIPQLRRRKIDILHVQDPGIAVLIQKARKLGLVKTRTILGHGTEEPLSFLKNITYLQHLAPWHLEETKAAGVHKPTWTAIPNFIDTEIFSTHSGADAPVGSSALESGADAPVGSSVLERRAALRTELQIPLDAPVVLTVAAIKRDHKRIDYLLSEFAALLAHQPSAHLIVAGGHESDTDDLIREGTQKLGTRVHFLVRFPRERIPDLYRAADIFTLCSLKEMMPIALIEAAASGLPCITHHHPVMQWMTGPGGESIDMASPGTLAAALASLLANPTRLRALGTAARQHCLENFSKDRVLRQILDYYHFVLTHDKTKASQEINPIEPSSHPSKTPLNHSTI